MKILALDTSTSVMGVALLDDQKVYGEITTNVKTNHSVRLMPSIELLFQEVDWKPEEIDLVAIAQGPGSYTGVRIGVTTAKTLAWSLNKPIIGISTLEAMAYQNKEFKGLISPMIDARRGQVYTGLYQKQQTEWKNLEVDRIILLTDWLERLRERDEQVLFVGDDVTLHQEKIKEALGEKAVISEPPFGIPRPSIIGYLAKKEYERGRVDNVFDFVPEYLQLAEAEVKWLEKQKKQSST
ncbi:tRNA (adenosine(37)-N6)-threonylcarbamoyltransferase complex dimerization subunit type 1 TsaB [Tepidibacillus fermentans]|uniref:tRNA threonylcarbamoyladenosine biosynthesis protein TsaB n=1 Tax=Tepidibacillus fermentans TaxID=1281767 RepID=A0A4R3K9J6_9BACI|nr:tRNA (adenosine(37)-N6)-threonylcarbamoyltransferase complex dimerization subunit type 1 TsaB [Tepidibacillus fermentans]TCS79575.1 tRNA threonylcarbamoyladenosine biosynthesis protein TsaB [Tepidibacillus fermentans]